MSKKDTKPEITFSFKVEWFDSQAEILRPYLLYYYTNDQTLEMYDVRNRRTFLKRCSYPSVKMGDLFIGAQLTVYARQLKVIDYADDFTRRQLSNNQTRNLLLAKPAAYKKIGGLIDMIYNGQFVISRLKMCFLNQQQACEFFGDERPTERASELTGGPVVAIEVVGQDVAQRLGFGQANSEMHMSSERDADMEIKYLLQNPRIGSTASLNNCSICVIKPHAVLAGVAGQIVDSIVSAGFRVSAMQMFNLDKTAASEFLEVYKGVSPEYNLSVEQFSSGPCIALEVCGDADVVTKFREFCGPNDPEVARHIRPSTLRAEFGQDKVKNAVHCTDLPEDGVLESEYFFSILQKMR